MSNLKVLVVGASIAGPSTAYWFAKAGANVTVIERFPKLREGGQNVDIRSVGVTVMRKMEGLEAAVRARLCPMEGFNLVDKYGRSYGVMKPSGDPDQQSLISEFEIFRSDLGHILYDMTKDNERIKYIFGEQVRSLKQDGDGPMTVEFANGTPTSDYDLVVACDGATSRTRAIGLDCGVRDHVESMNTWAAWFTIEKDVLNGSKWGHALSGVGGRFMAVGPDRSGANRVVVMDVRPTHEHDPTADFRDAAKKGDDELKRYVAQRYQGVGWKTDEIMQGLLGANDFYGTEIVRVTVPSLYKGRFALVGDAGYFSGFTGTGTSLAMAGAYILAGEVSKHQGDLAAGLKAYDARLRPIIDDLHITPPGIRSFMAPQTAWGIWIRNLIFVLIVQAMTFGKLLAWIPAYFSNSFAKDKYNIPDYEWMY